VESKPILPTATAKAVPRKTRRTLHPAYTIASALVILSVLAFIAREVQSHTNTAELVTPASEHAPAERTSEKAPEPDSRPTEFVSLATGTRVQQDVRTDGHGEFNVDNGTDDDAVVSLVDYSSNQSVRCFFVQAHTSAHVQRISQGNYTLAFTTGLDWNAAEFSFGWHPSYSEFEHTFEFKERRDSEGVNYKSISITLHAVPTGSVRTRPITRQEFLRGQGDSVVRNKGY
jgi:hypothetical protein